MPELLTYAEAAKRLDITPRTLRRMVNSGEFPEPVRRNQRWVRIPDSDINEYLTKLIDSRQVATK
jgi:excisionase family DNA binding protein